MCGITNAQDAEFAAKAGANFIGMIMWPKAGRYVPPPVAHDIASAAHDNGAQAVGVFVDESPEKIWNVCESTNVSIAQLHGPASQEGLSSLEESLKVIYVLKANPEGCIESGVPDGEKQPDWYLIDSLKGGSGISFDWSKLTLPQQCTNKWFLAGGLNPTNVAEAVRTARPVCVDVSSGVCGPDGLRKDPEKVQSFIECVKHSL